MNYDESVSLERKAIFRYLPINETIVVLSSRIWERVVPLPGKSILGDFSYHLSFCQIACFYDQDMIFMVIACIMFKVFYVDLPMGQKPLYKAQINV